MKVSEVIAMIDGQVQCGPALELEVTGCYVSDLLSDVLSHSKGGELWVTQHTHSNVVAVASVKEIAAVVVVGGKAIDADTLARAEAEKVNFIVTRLSAFEVAGMMYSVMKKGGA